MTRLETIRSRVIQKSHQEASVGTGKMRIPGMKIGTQMAPGGPTYEDVMWLLEKIEKAKEILKRSGDGEAKLLVDEINRGS